MRFRLTILPRFAPADTSQGKPLTKNSEWEREPNPERFSQAAIPAVYA
jgi:hypothetical protein